MICLPYVYITLLSFFLVQHQQQINVNCLSVKKISVSFEASIENYAENRKSDYRVLHVVKNNVMDSWRS